MEELLSSKTMFRPEQPVNFYVYNSSFVTQHKHADFYELFIITKGTVEHRINGQTYKMTLHDYCIVRPNDSHAMKNIGTKASQHLNFRIMPSYFHRECDAIFQSFLRYILDAKIAGGRLSKEEYSQLNYWLSRLLSVSPNDTEKTEFFIQAVVRLLLSFFYANTTFANSQYPDWFKLLLQKVNSTAFLEKTAKDIYSTASYSSNHVIKAFKQYLGVTPTQYLTKLKLDYACNLLKNTDHTTLYIANQIGIFSLSHFNDIFKKNLNLTPSEYKKANK